MLGYHTPPQEQTHPHEQTSPLSRHPPEQTPPQGRACWEIRSTRGRYASYWNAVLFWMDFKASVGHATKLSDRKSKEVTQQSDRKAEVLPCVHIPQLAYRENKRDASANMSVFNISVYGLELVPCQ